MLVVSVKIIEWLKERKPELNEISLDQNLMNTGALDSLQFVSFLMFIEQLREKKIPQEEVIPDNFLTINEIMNTFFNIKNENNGYLDE